MEKQFILIKDIFDNYIIFDREKKEIWKIEQTGLLENITKLCEKSYKKEINKPTPKKGKLITGLWYQFLDKKISTSKACISTDSILMETNNRQQFEKMIQKEHNIVISRLLKKLNKNGA